MPHHVEAMLETYPKDLGDIDKQALAACIEACFQCAQTCTACADACLSEDMVAELTTCIRNNLDCPDVCDATGRVLSRHTGYDPSITRAVVDACQAACCALRHAGGANVLAPICWPRCAVLASRLHRIGAPGHGDGRLATHVAVARRDVSRLA